MASFRGRGLNIALRVAVKTKLRRQVTVEGIRAAAAMLGNWIGRDARAHTGELVRAGAVPSERFAPVGGDEHRVLLYLHGGGFVSHMPPAYRVFARRLADLLGANVLLPDYRLAPEHPFPRGLDDCLDAYRWLLTRGVDPKRVIIAGDSAGGNLALVTAIRIRDAGLPGPGCVVMLSPATDLTGGSASLRYNRDKDPLIVPDVLPYLLSQYAPSEKADHPWLSPIFADFAGLPALLFHAGSTEVILDDSIRAAERGRAAGVAIELKVWPDMPHVFQVFDWLPEAKAACADIARFVRQHVPSVSRAESQFVGQSCFNPGRTSNERSSPATPA